MRFHVIVTPEAQTGVRESFLYIREQSPLNAARWLQMLYKKIDTLERMPERSSSVREQEYLEEDLRQLVFKSHRIVFQIAMRNAAPSVSRLLKTTSKDHVKRDFRGEVLGVRCRRSARHFSVACS